MIAATEAATFHGSQVLISFFMESSGSEDISPSRNMVPPLYP